MHLEVNLLFFISMKKNSILVLFFAMFFATLNVYGQKAYSLTYEDFMADRWEPLDSLAAKERGDSRKIWWGGNDFTLTTNDSKLDKIIKKNAFIVAMDSTLFLNCRNLRYEKTQLGNGFVPCRRIGQRSILFVNRLIGKKEQSKAAMAGMMFGAIGGAIAASTNVKKRVCYVISDGANEKGRINIRLVDDKLIEKMLDGRDDLKEQYYSEKKEDKRILATRVIPILEKAGLIQP